MGAIVSTPNGYHVKSNLMKLVGRMAVNKLCGGANEASLFLFVDAREAIKPRAARAEPHFYDGNKAPLLRDDV